MFKMLINCKLKTQVFNGRETRKLDESFSENEIVFALFINVYGVYMFSKSKIRNQIHIKLQKKRKMIANSRIKY